RRRPRRRDGHLPCERGARSGAGLSRWYWAGGAAAVGKVAAPGGAPHPRRPRPYPGAMQRRGTRRSPVRRSRLRFRPFLAALAALLVLTSCSQLKEQAGDVVEHAIEDAVGGLDLT